ncbi:hypothetical protein FAMCQIZV_CDS0028 [Phage C72C1]|nr:hypothetical protein FAMCQIZV_CDS0028 [Phage C72C1]
MGNSTTLSTKNSLFQAQYSWGEKKSQQMRFFV